MVVYGPGLSAAGPAAGSRQDARSAPEVRPITIEDVFRCHAQDVHRLVTRLLGPGAGRADVEDLGQQVFMALHVALPKFRGESKLSTWVYGVTSRIVYRELRRRSRHRRMVERLGQTLPTAEGPRQEAAAELRQVWRALMGIDPKKRMVLVLHDVEGLSGPEIAKVLGIKLPTVHSRLFYARRELMRALEAQP